MKPLAHKATWEQIDRWMKEPRGSWLLHGPAQVGKATIAAWIAKQLNCDGCSDNSCRSCRLALSGSHPDIIVIQPDDKGTIGIEAVQNLAHKLTLVAYQVVGQRVVIVEDADSMTIPAQNALLKTLEEPPADTVILLSAARPQVLLPTIVSRCQKLHVPAVEQSEIESFIRKTYPSVESGRIAELSQGAVGLAIGYAEDSESLASRDALDQKVTALMEGSLFERLQIASELGGADKGVGVLDTLAARLQKVVRSKPSQQTASALQALVALRQRLAANVNSKSAWEAFALELQW